jgi:hypothetical protein
VNLEVEIHSDRDHVPVVIELFVDDVLVFGFDFLEPDIAIGAVDGKMFIEKKLEPTTGVKTEPVLRIVEIARSID